MSVPEVRLFSRLYFLVINMIPALIFVIARRKGTKVPAWIMWVFTLLGGGIGAWAGMSATRYEPKIKFIPYFTVAITLLIIVFTLVLSMGL